MAIVKKIVEANVQPQLNNMTVNNSKGNRAGARVTTNDKRTQIDIITDDTIAHMNTRLDSRLKESYAE
jgi:hypothetical protein